MEAVTVPCYGSSGAAPLTACHLFATALTHNSSEFVDTRPTITSNIVASVVLQIPHSSSTIDAVGRTTDNKMIEFAFVRSTRPLQRRHLECNMAGQTVELFKITSILNIGQFLE